MDYPTLIDPWTVVPTTAALVVHAGIAALELGLALWLVASAVRLLRGRTGGGSRGRLARWTRRGALASAAVVAAFAVYERDDPLRLGFEVLATAQQWRSHDLAWQQAADRTAPKVGELAPDFELQDPTGTTAVRLSDFRGRKPVALLFGSYT